MVLTKAFPRNLSFIQTRENSKCWPTDLARLLDLRNENLASEHQFFIILNFPYSRLISCKGSNRKITGRGMRLLKMIFVFLHHDGEYQLVQDKEVGCSRGFSSDLVRKSLFYGIFLCINKYFSLFKDVLAWSRLLKLVLVLLKHYLSTTITVSNFHFTKHLQDEISNRLRPTFCIRDAHLFP